MTHDPHDNSVHDHSEHDHSARSGHDHHEGEHHSGAHAEGHGHHHSAEGAPEAIAECPVMPGSTVNKADAEELGLYRDYEGTRYYFCCEACGPLWDAEPEKYATV